MPVNFMNGKVYTIDYETLRTELMDISTFLKNKQLQEMYISQWIEVLKKADENTCNSFTAPGNQKLIIKENLEAPERFQTIVKYKSNDLLIHFRVSRMCQILKSSDSSNKMVESIDVREFTEREEMNWTPTKDKVHIKSEPIIIAPFTIDRTYKFLVVDGNHRITDAIKKGKATVDSYVLDANWIVQGNLLCSQFDKMLYIFQNEIVAIATWIKRDGMSEEEAIKEIYFSSGVAKVEV